MGSKASTPESSSSNQVPLPFQFTLSPFSTASSVSTASPLPHQGQTPSSNTFRIQVDPPTCTFFPNSKSSKFHQIQNSIQITHDIVLDITCIQSCKVLFQFPHLFEPTSLQTVQKILKPRIGHFSSLLNSKQGTFVLGQGVGTSQQGSTSTYYNDVLLCYPLPSISCAIPSSTDYILQSWKSELSSNNKLGTIRFPIYSCKELIEPRFVETIYARCWNRSNLYFDTETSTPALVGFGGQISGPNGGNLDDVTTFTFSNTSWKRVSEYNSTLKPVGRVAHVSLTRNVEPHYISTESTIETRWKQKIVVFGGYNGSFLNDMWEYDPATQKWEPIAPSNQAPSVRCSHSANLFSSHSGLVMFGGWIGSNCRYNDTWLYEFENKTWTQLITSGKHPTPRQLHSSELIRDEYLIVMCGEDSTGLLNDCYILDLLSKEWKQVDLSPILSLDNTFYETLRFTSPTSPSKNPISPSSDISTTTTSSIFSPFSTSTPQDKMSDDGIFSSETTIYTPTLQPSIVKRRGASTICIDDPVESCVRIILFGGIGDIAPGRREALGDMYEFKISYSRKIHMKMQEQLLHSKVDHFSDVQFYFTE